MTEIEHTSDSELDDPKKITDAASCLDYLKRREVFLYKMMNDPSHKAMLYFLEVLMNSEAPMTVEQLAARFTHKSFSPEMRDACGGGSPEGLREFLLRYPSLFNVRENGQVTSVAIELPGLEGLPEGTTDVDLCLIPNSYCPSSANESIHSVAQDSHCDISSRSSGIKGNYRPRFFGKPCDQAIGKFKGKSSSSLSLVSTPSNASTSSGSMASFNKPGFGERSEREPGNSTSLKSTTPGIVRRGSNPSISAWNKPGIYQPPHLREQKNATCEPCSTKPQCCCTVEATTACVHCPLLNFTYHHCPVTHHHHTPTHCVCTTTRLNSNAHCHSCCPILPTTVTNLSTRTSVNTSTVCALPPMEKLLLETEAVRFFQQRLLKREERWVPIKSLAGHLSQATPEVRSVVGPQLEFRSFLLKHPHVFEVQGELVSVKDPLGNIFPQRKSRDRLAAIHSSFSSTNLNSSGLGTISSQTALVRTTGRERVQRPKSLILPNATQLLPNAFVTPSFTVNSRRNLDNRRSTHFAENFVTASYFTNNGSIQSGTSSAPNTPTGIHHSPSENQQATPIPKFVVGTHRSDGTHSSHSPMQSAVCSSTESDQSVKQTGITSILGNLKSISISMSANEYRSIMFLRKVLEKKGGGPGESGVALPELMQLISVKSMEPVQSTIGWTIIELKEFLSQHSIFFELLNEHQEKPEKSPTDPQNAENLIQILVRNKRLEKMINIVITGTKPTEPNVRTLTNRCGRIFHVAKLWGIIDLGKHEHVFFDKSIFKHVDDLQKYFKVDEVLYFNAILAPKESRAKWRATQVWKECDRQNFEKMGGIFATNRSNLLTDDSRGQDPVDQTGKLPHNKLRGYTTGTGLPAFSQAPDNEDTEADEEIEDIEVENSEMFPLNESNGFDCEFVLNGEDDFNEEEPYISALAREEGLNLVNDVRFIADEGIHRESLVNETMESNKKVQGRACQTSQGLQNFTVYTESDKGNNFVSSSTENTPSECASLQNSHICSSGLSLKDDNATTTSSTSSSAISIAVQTVSTGEIMATQLYHDAAKLSRMVTQVETV